MKLKFVVLGVILLIGFNGWNELIHVAWNGLYYIHMTHFDFDARVTWVSTVFRQASRAMFIFITFISIYLIFYEEFEKLERKLRSKIRMRKVRKDDRN